MGSEYDALRDDLARSVSDLISTFAEKRDLEIKQILHALEGHNSRMDTLEKTLLERGKVSDAAAFEIKELRKAVGRTEGQLNVLIRGLEAIAAGTSNH